MTQLTFASVDEEAAGSSEVDGVVDPEALQVLTHLPSLREFRVDIFKVNLLTADGKRKRFRKNEIKTPGVRVDSLYLHHQVHEAFVVVAGHRRVRTDHQLPVYSRRQIDVLPWRR